MFDEPVPCVAQGFRDAEAGVGVIDDQSQGGLADSVLTKGDLNEVVRRMNVYQDGTILIYVCTDQCVGTS